MYLPYLIFISGLMVLDVNSECNDYINCFTDFLQEYFGTKNRTTKDLKVDGATTKLVELNEDNPKLNAVLTDISDLIKQIDAHAKRSETVQSVNDKTQIYVKAYELDANKQIYVAEESTEDTTTEDITDVTTETVDFTDILSDYGTTATDLLDISVIPLKSEENSVVDRDFFYYDIPDDNSTDYPIIDYIDLYKDTTNPAVPYTESSHSEEVLDLVDEITGKEKDIDNNIEYSLTFLPDEVLSDLLRNVINNTIHTCNGDSKTLSKAVFPWVAAIFVKNDSKSNQFEYFCDGALISKRVVLTAARCVFNGNVTQRSEDFIVFLGKTSLQESGDQESIQKVKSVDLHPGFTIGEGKNDLAMLVLEDAVNLTDSIQVACLRRDGGSDDDNGEAITTAWSLSGNLTLIYFDKEKSKACGPDNKVENTYCATYGNDVALCPSYGGIYVSETLNNSLYLAGTRFGNPTDRGLCFSRDVSYISLSGYTNWITKYIDSN